jgi:hypothetical protein
MLSKKGHTWV